MAEWTLQIDGMHCGACVRRVTQALGAVEGLAVEEVRVGAARCNSANEQVLAAIEAIAKIGFTARLSS